MVLKSTKIIKTKEPQWQHAAWLFNPCVWKCVLLEIVVSEVDA